MAQAKVRVGGPRPVQEGIGSVLRALLCHPGAGRAPREPDG